MDSANLPIASRPRAEDEEQEKDEDDALPEKKRIKLEAPLMEGTSQHTPITESMEEENSPKIVEESSQTKYDTQNLLPPSLKLLGVAPPTETQDGARVTREIDVGISEYIGADIPSIEGIIKQRFTDFLVFEVNTEGQVVRLKSIERPNPNAGIHVKERPIPSQGETPPVSVNTISEHVTAPAGGEGGSFPDPTINEVPASGSSLATTDTWLPSFTERLEGLLSANAIEQLKEIYLQGPEPILTNESGLASGVSKSDDQEMVEEQPEPVTSQRGRGRGRGDRGRRGGRGARAGGSTSKKEDNRKVFSEPFTSKDERTKLHQTIRELFQGKLETQATETSGEEGSRIVIRWFHGGRGGDRRSELREPRPDRPPVLRFIHFTLQKTNRDTQDALSHLSRLTGVHVKDFAVAGTKDKRGVTVQRVSMKRNGRSLEQFWKAANGVGNRRTENEAITQRAERGVRVGDIEWGSYPFKLGMQNGNTFVITLRNVKTDSDATLERAMETLKNKGFINYYGMQRFGTSSIPTHSIGLAVLQSNWDLAVSLILRPRPGEFPDAEKARRAWLEENDLNRALELIPRRCVAERCILEYFKKKDRRGKKTFLAFSSIPLNLRLMYIHAYQSYVWNAIVSERVKNHGCEKPIVGDLVYDKSTLVGVPIKDPDIENAEMADLTPAETTEPPEETDQVGERNKKDKPKWKPPKLQTLSECDLSHYSIFDVIMPLPGRDVTYPGGTLGERYREFLRADGLDPDTLTHAQRDYSLLGSYRHILHLPKELAWSVLRYTDPDVALTQSDEDKLLGLDTPMVQKEGNFTALQMNLTLGSSSYATMAIREVTKTETSAYHQTMLTQISEDQAYKGATHSNPSNEVLKHV